MMGTQRRACGRGSQEWKSRCVLGELTIQGTINVSRIWEEANGLRAGRKTGKMKGLTCEVSGVFIDYSRISDTLEVISSRQ